MLILFPTRHGALVTAQGWMRAKLISKQTFFVKCPNVCLRFTLSVVPTMHLGRKCVSTLPQCGTCDVMAICVTGWLKGSAMVTCHIAVESYATATRLDPSGGALGWNLGYKRLPCYRDLKFKKVLKLSPRQNSMKFSWSDSRSKMFSDGGGTNFFPIFRACWPFGGTDD